MSQLNPPPIRDSVDQDSRLGLRASWQAWFSQLFKWLQSLGNSVSKLVSNNTGINTGDQTNITGTAANLSGTPALPNGTTATTQANGDSSTKLANDAFVQAALTYYNTPVAWDGSTDRVLGVGQITQDSFTSATSMPLHIACGDGQVYEIEMNGVCAVVAGTSDAYLQMNNAAPSATFNFFALAQSGNTTVGGSLTASAGAGFEFTSFGVSPYSATINAFTSTANKVTRAFYFNISTSSANSGMKHCQLLDTTTVWSSLGTIAQPNAWTGQVVCRRIA